MAKKSKSKKVKSIKVKEVKVEKVVEKKPEVKETIKPDIAEICSHCDSNMEKVKETDLGIEYKCTNIEHCGRGIVIDNKPR